MQIGRSKTRPQSLAFQKFFTVSAGVSFFVVDGAQARKTLDLSSTAAKDAGGGKALELLRSIGEFCKNHMLLAIIQIAFSLVRQMSRVLSKRPWSGPTAVAAVAVSVSAMANAAGLISEDDYNRCRAISDDRAQLLCFESLNSPNPHTTPSPVAPDGAANTPAAPPGSISGSQSRPSSIPVAGKWRLVRTPDPRAGKDIVSIMATAELVGSDVDFAGVDLRCADPGFEVLIFVVGPLRRQARPVIAINGKRFDGNVVSPGTVILLPREASNLARDQWRSFHDLSVEVEDDGKKTQGIISLEGFDTALQTLVGTCSTR